MIHQSTPKTERQTINVWPDFAQMLGVGKNAIYAGAKRGDFRTIRIGGRMLVPKSEVQRLLGNAD